MSNRRLTPEQRAQREALPRGPTCRSRSIQSKTYPDAVLHVCKGCRFPWRTAVQAPETVASRVRSVFQKVAGSS